MVDTGAHVGDHFVYPDCRPEFVEAFSEVQKKAVHGFGEKSLRLYSPFLKWTKADIVVAGARLEVPYAEPGAAMRVERFTAAYVRLVSGGGERSRRWCAGSDGVRACTPLVGDDLLYQYS